MDMNTTAKTPERLRLAEEFLENVYATDGGERIKKCLQCGNCSASCPAGRHMEFPPRVVFAALRAGQLDTVLKSNTIWMCASCYSCQVRCPVQIKITEVMYVLKRMAFQKGLVKHNRMGPLLTRVFMNLVKRDGRNSEGLLGMELFMKGKGLLATLKEMPFAMRLWLKGRLSVKRERIREPGKLARALEKIGGE